MGVLSKLFGKKSKLQSKDLASIYTLSKNKKIGLY